MTETLLPRLVVALVVTGLAFGCGGSATDSGGDSDGAGASGGDGDNPSGDGDGDNASGDGDGDNASGDGDGDEGSCTDRSGTPTIDGVLQAGDDLVAAAQGASADFEASVATIESELGLEGAGSLNARVDAVIAALAAEVEANTNGLWIYGVRTECGSDVAVAREAQLSCERTLCGGGEDVNAEQIPVECEGACLGSCEGSCSGVSSALCRNTISAEACEGICDGTCEPTEAAGCDGICTGACTGTCTETDESGCVGECDGDCGGTCTLREPGACEGACTGTCLAEVSGACSGEVVCDSECLGECRGTCAGTVLPAAGLADCEPSADCQAQAGALSLAHASCTAAALRHAFEFVGSEGAAAEFASRMSNVVAELQAVEDSFNLLSALLEGEVNGEVVYEHPPLLVVVLMLESIASAGASGDLFSTVEDDRVPCVFPALVEALEMLRDTALESSYLLETQATLVQSARSGFN